MSEIPFTVEEIDKLHCEFPEVDIPWVYLQQFIPWAEGRNDIDWNQNQVQKFRHYLGKTLKIEPSRDARIVLAVPLEEKNAAKALGAQFDWVDSVWFIASDANPEPFKRWLPDQRQGDDLRDRIAILEAQVEGLQKGVAYLSRILDKQAV